MTVEERKINIEIGRKRKKKKIVQHVFRGKNEFFFDTIFYWKLQFSVTNISLSQPNPQTPPPSLIVSMDALFYAFSQICQREREEVCGTLRKSSGRKVNSCRWFDIVNAPFWPLSITISLIFTEWRDWLCFSLTIIVE